MDQQSRLIELCKELRLPSIRRMVQDSSTFKRLEQAHEVLYQVLTQERENRIVRAKQVQFRIVQRKPLS